MLVYRPINSDIVAQGWFRQARTSRKAHFSALSDEDEAWRNQNKQIGQDFADGTLAFGRYRARQKKSLDNLPHLP